MIVIPRHQVFVKFVDVPSLDESEIAKMAEFQIVKEIPHPKESLIISYRNLGSHREGFSSLMLAVATKEMIEEKISEFPHLDSVRLFSELLYLFLLKENVAGQDKASLFIHVGRENSEIMIIDHSQLIFSRGFKDSGAFLDETERSILAYKREKIKPEIEDIIVVHPSGVNIEDKTEKIKSQFTIPVRFYEYSQDLSLLDLRPQINLMPEEIRDKRKGLKKKRESMVTYFLIGVVIMLFSVLVYSKIHEKNKTIDAFSTKVEELDSRIEGLGEFLKKTEIVKSHLERGNFIIKVLEDFYLTVPQDISISGLDYDGKKNIFYKGNSKTMATVLNYVKRLEDSKYFSKVEVKYTTKKKVKGEEIIDFNLRCQLSAFVYEANHGR
ncbi:PilN domain-containing protein [Candidatus Omnitrophota bacterium]